MYIYENSIKKIGRLVNEFGDEAIILFGDKAPSTLEEYSYTIEIKPTLDTILPNDILVIDDNEYSILAVGNVSEKNLISLGHLTINFTGDIEALLPGSIVVKGDKKSTLKIGTKIKIYRK